VLGATHPEEVTFPTFEGVLEEGEEDSASNPRKAHPEAFPLLFHFEEVKKNVHRRWDAQVPTQDLKGPYEGPAIWM